MDRRKKNNILIGILCCALIFMGIGYAVLNATLSIGATANITGDFDIHFTSIQRSSTTIEDSTLLSTMTSGTGITNSPTNTTGQFTAVLQKPGDYVIYNVVVANTGSIDGYLTFTFGDTNNNFSYYDDFYSVQFIRDDTEPDIIADILQNQTFTDSEVLVKTSGTRTYKIKVTYKSTAESFPDATTNGDFACTLNLTYSQQAPVQNQGGGSGQQEQNLAWYVGNDNGVVLAVALAQINNNAYNLEHFIVEGEDIIPYMNLNNTSFVPYTSSVTFDVNYLGSIEEGDYVLIVNDGQQMVYFLLRNNTIYGQPEPGEGKQIVEFSLNPNATISDFTS